MNHYNYCHSPNNALTYIENPNWGYLSLNKDSSVKLPFIMKDIYHLARWTRNITSRTREKNSNYTLMFIIALLPIVMFWKESSSNYCSTEGAFSSGKIRWHVANKLTFFPSRLITGADSFWLTHVGRIYLPLFITLFTYRRLSVAQNWNVLVFSSVMNVFKFE